MSAGITQLAGIITALAVVHVLIEFGAWVRDNVADALGEERAAEPEAGGERLGSGQRPSGNAKTQHLNKLRSHSEQGVV